MSARIIFGCMVSLGDTREALDEQESWEQASSLSWFPLKFGLDEDGVLGVKFLHTDSISPITLPEKNWASEQFIAARSRAEKILGKPWPYQEPKFFLVAS